MRFDWYQATIAAHPVEVVEGLLAGLGGDLEVRDCRAHNGYTQGFQIVDAAGEVARIDAGGSNGDPNAKASGDHTDAFVRVVREMWPELHRVTRCDPAQDFEEAGAFDKLMGVCIGHADEQPKPLKVEHAGDWHRAEDGRTLYVGSRKSPFRARLYEKGVQLQRELPHRAHEFSRDRVRLELQARPAGTLRHLAAVATPEQVWGFATWTRMLAEKAMGVVVPKASVSTYREADHWRSFRWMVGQYGRALEKCVEDLGSWEALALQMRDDIERLKADGR